MNYVKIYQYTKKNQSNNIIGVVNAKLVENINWYIRPAEAEAGSTEYQIHGMYYGSTADVDFSLNIPALTTVSAGGPSETFDTEGKKAKIMNIMVDGITKACQSTFTSPGSTIVNWYPPFDIGSDFVIESNPFQPAQQVGGPGEEFLDPGGVMEGAPEAIPEGPFEGAGGPPEHMAG
jgi:hypothetical protein